MKKPSLVTLLLLLVFALLVAACSSKPANQTSSSSPPATKESTAPTGSAAPTGSTEPVDNTPVKLTFWYALSGANGQAFSGLIDQFNASQSRITVEAIYSGSYADTATKMMAALTSRTEPNGALMAVGPLYTGPRNNTKMLDFIQNDPVFNMADIYDGMWEYAKYNDKIVSVPYNISTPILYYNKKIFADAGLDASKPPKDWLELLDYAKKAKATNKSGEFWGFDTSDAPWTFKAFLGQNGNTLIQASGDNITPVFDEASGVETAAYWRLLVDEGVMPAGQHDLSEKRFLSGNLAMIISSSARMGKWSTDSQIEFGAFPLPSMKKSAVPLGGGMLVQFNKSDREDQATYELIKFLTSKEVIADFSVSTGYLPVRKSALDLPSVQDKIKENPMYKVAFDQLNDSWAYWNFDQMGAMDFMIYEALEKIEKGTATPEAAMQDLKQQLINEIKAAK